MYRRGSVELSQVTASLGELVMLVRRLNPPGELSLTALGTSDGTHEPLGVAVRSWGARRRFDNCDFFTAKEVIERTRELRVPVADEETERGDPVRHFNRQVAGSLCNPWLFDKRYCTGQDTCSSTSIMSHRCLCMVWWRKRRAKRRVGGRPQIRRGSLRSPRGSPIRRAQR